MKSYTDIEQSKKLADILPLESADMYYWCGEDLRVGGYKAIDIDYDIPCWSLAALLSVLPKIHKLKPILDLEENSIQYSGTDVYVVADNPVDACYEVIIKLNKLNLL